MHGSPGGAGGGDLLLVLMHLRRYPHHEARRGPGHLHAGGDGERGGRRESGGGRAVDAQNGRGRGHRRPAGGRRRVRTRLSGVYRRRLRGLRARLPSAAALLLLLGRLRLSSRLALRLALGRLLRWLLAGSMGLLLLQARRGHAVVRLGRVVPRVDVRWVLPVYLLRCQEGLRRGVVVEGSCGCGASAHRQARLEKKEKGKIATYQKLFVDISCTNKMAIRESENWCRCKCAASISFANAATCCFLSHLILSTYAPLANVLNTLPTINR